MQRGQSSSRPGRRLLIGLALLALTLLGGLGLGLATAFLGVFPYPQFRDFVERQVAAPSAPGQAVSTGWRRDSQFFPLSFRRYRAPVSRPYIGVGGGLAPLEAQAVVMDALGNLYLYTPGGLFEPLAPALDLGRSALLTHIGQAEGDRRLLAGRFRALDVLAHTQDGGLTLYASHNGWDAARACYDLRVSTARISGWAQGDRRADGGWRTLYRSRPCIPVEEDSATGGLQSGGRLVMRDDGLLLLSVGDFERDGLVRPERWSRDGSVDYGKVLSIDPATGATSILARGLRNPQGLALGSDGTLWETEHGPRGGDELNRIEAGGDYGWPDVTLGTQYGRFNWPGAANPGRHLGFTAPVHAWVPSIGISNLLEIRHGPDAWRGDLLVGSLRARRLYRLRQREGRVLYVEPIRVKEQVRDLVELIDGTVLLWSDDGDVLEMRAVDPKAVLQRPGLTAEEARLGLGAILDRCQHCHSLSSDGRHASGPDLWGIMGRPIGGQSKGRRLPSALGAVGGTWDRERLEAFLLDPGRFAPGVRMPPTGLTEPEARAVVDYLSRLRD